MEETKPIFSFTVEWMSDGTIKKSQDMSEDTVAKLSEDEIIKNICEAGYYCSKYHIIDRAINIITGQNTKITHDYYPVLGPTEPKSLFGVKVSYIENHYDIKPLNSEISQFKAEEFLIYLSTCYFAELSRRRVTNFAKAIFDYTMSDESGTAGVKKLLEYGLCK